jgi:anti-sigma regulatory factor (Ser/Thr protein kinase)
VELPKGHGGPMSITLQPGLQACRAARRFVYYAADQWLGQARLADVLTVVTEFVANASTHARTPMVLNLVPHGDHVLVELYDESESIPARLESSGAEAGLGLRIVDGVAARWGVDLRDGGKVVWAEV